MGYAPPFEDGLWSRLMARLEAWREMVGMSAEALRARFPSEERGPVVWAAAAGAAALCVGLCCAYAAFSTPAAETASGEARVVRLGAEKQVVIERGGVEVRVQFPDEGHPVVEVTGADEPHRIARAAQAARSTAASTR